MIDLSDRIMYKECQYFYKIMKGLSLSCMYSKYAMLKIYYCEVELLSLHEVSIISESLYHLLDTALLLTY